MLSPKLTLLAFLIGFGISVAAGLFVQGLAATLLNMTGAAQLASLPNAALIGIAAVIGLPLLIYLLRRLVIQPASGRSTSAEYSGSSRRAGGRA